MRTATTTSIWGPGLITLICASAVVLPTAGCGSGVSRFDHTPDAVSLRFELEGWKRALVHFMEDHEMQEQLAETRLATIVVRGNRARIGLWVVDIERREAYMESDYYLPFGVWFERDARGVWSTIMQPMWMS